MTNVLTGKYFHAVKPDRQTITWVGQILALVSPGVYQVQLLNEEYRPYQQRLVAASDMRFWIIFDTEREMKTEHILSRALAQGKAGAQ